jgi:hypothetical protein
VIEKIKRLHPHASTELPPLPPTAPVVEIKIEQIHRALRGLNRDAAPGVSGWTVPLLQIALQSKEVQEFVRVLIQKMCNNEIKNRHPLLWSRLFAVPKPNSDGVRPIACGELLCKIAASIGFSNIKDALEKKLAHTQYALGKKGGVQRVIQSLQGFCMKFGDDPDFMIASVDYANAFNCVSRHAIFDAVMADHELQKITRLLYFLYSDPSPLFILDQNNKTHTLFSASGVRQGDILGMALFCLAVNPVYESAARKHDIKIKSYADDPFLLGDATKVLDGLVTLEEESKKINLLMNKTKLRFYFPNAKSSEDIQPDILSRIEEFGGVIKYGGLEALGGVVGCDVKVLSEAYCKKIDQKLLNINLALGRKSFPHQYAYHAIKTCFSQQISFLCRVSPPTAFADAAERWDAAMSRCLSAMMGIEIHESSLEYYQTTLPAKDGFPGLGIPSARTVNRHAWMACVIESLPEFQLDDTLEDMMRARLMVYDEVNPTTFHEITCRLNKANTYECFRKLKLWPADEKFPTEFDHKTLNRIFQIFHAPQDQPSRVQSSRSRKPRAIKLQKALVDAAHAEFLPILVECDEESRDWTSDQKSYYKTKILSACATDSSLPLKTLPMSDRYYLPNLEFSFYLRMRLGLRLDVYDVVPEYCSCGEHLNHDYSAYHFLSCQQYKGGYRTGAHNAIVAQLERFLKSCRIHCSSEPYAITAPAAALDGKIGKKLDLMIFFPGWDKVGVDVSITCQFGNSYFKNYNSPGYCAEQRAKEKTRKHESSTCRYLECSFVPLTLECTGGMGKDSTDLIKKIARLARVKKPTSILRRDIQITHTREMFALYKDMFKRAVDYPYRPRRRPTDYRVAPPRAPANSSPDIKDAPVLIDNKSQRSVSEPEVKQQAIVLIRDVVSLHQAEELVQEVENKLRRDENTPQRHGIQPLHTEPDTPRMETQESSPQSPPEMKLPPPAIPLPPAPEPSPSLIPTEMKPAIPLPLEPELSPSLIPSEIMTRSKTRLLARPPDPPPHLPRRRARRDWE